MRRMNSMFHGHQGASARTTLHVALDRQRGSPGRPTRAAGARCGSAPRGRRVAGQRRARQRDQRRASRRGRRARRGRSGSAASGCPATRSTTPAQRRSRPEPRPSAPARGGAASRSSTYRRRTRRAGSGRRRAGYVMPRVVGRRPPAGTAPGRRARQRRGAPVRIEPGGRRGRRGTKRTGVAGRAAGRSSRARARTTVAGQTKPPRLGPSGPSMIGMSPVKSIVPTA